MCERTEEWIPEGSLKSQRHDTHQPGRVSCNICQQVIEMASPKYKGFLRKKLNSELDMVVSSLRKENAYLKKTLVELSRQHSEHNKLVERFLSLETVRLESCQQMTAKDENIALPPEQLSKKEEKLMDVVSMRRNRSISSYAREIEEIKNKLVSVAARCQYLENNVAGKKDSASDESASTNNEIELKNHLSDALEKNKQWLEYDQQREAYVRGIVARMLWLEKQLNEANKPHSQQHNEDHSDEKERLNQMLEYYERLLQKAKDELEVLREQVNMTQQNLIITRNWCEEKESEVEELKQQLQTEKMSRKSALEDCHCSENEEQWLRDKTKDFQHRLDEEKRRSANFELQIKISSQDLEDERQDCSYLKKQMVRVLKTLQKTKDHVKKQSKRDHQDHSSCEAAHPPSLPSRDSLTSSPHNSLVNESFLECPSCRAEYPASHYRELMNHLEICLD
ncbi:centrosomal protein of 55 kDa-like isoform X2 [Siniperca chuatsi]|uniref:centrosomal protein of 55 kDa-like isoform X2 n=1 Tax=Siniperca chuatsi TaxID=119488 RepID=UPI001CE0E1A8|nr:centrosomal protein of 55 kDa-like isoform X2 [Siniperca chuatsi]